MRNKSMYQIYFNKINIVVYYINFMVRKIIAKNVVDKSSVKYN